MEEKKVQLVFEFDRSEYDAFLFLMDQKKDEEAEQVWEAMSKAPIKCDYNAFEGECQDSETDDDVRCHSISQGTCKGKMTMAQEVTNFARFFAAFNKLPYNGSREEFKKQIVLQYTWNRTDSLREMTRREYNDCCDALEKLNGQKDEQKKRRSECLKLMQKLGIDTTDWTRINAFCQDPRIAGKVFARLSNEELEQLSVKLRSIRRKGGLKPKNTEVKPQVGVAYVIRMDANTPTC